MYLSWSWNRSGYHSCQNETGTGHNETLETSRFIVNLRGEGTAQGLVDRGQQRKVLQRRTNKGWFTHQSPGYKATTLTFIDVKVRWSIRTVYDSWHQVCFCYDFTADVTGNVAIEAQGDYPVEEPFVLVPSFRA